MERKTGEPAVVAVRPAVVGAPEVGGVAHLCTAHLHSPVQAHVEHRPDVAVGIAGDDEGVVEDSAHDVVAVLRDLGFVGDEQPGAAEETLLFQLEQLFVVVDVRGDHPAPDVTEDFIEGTVVIDHGDLQSRALLSVIQRTVLLSRECRRPTARSTPLAASSALPAGIAVRMTIALMLMKGSLRQGLPQT